MLSLRHFRMEDILEVRIGDDEGDVFFVFRRPDTDNIELIIRKDGEEFGIFLDTEESIALFKLLEIYVGG